MLIHIILSIIIVSIAGLAFAYTSYKLGRGDKRIGCGGGTCGSCNPNNTGQSCPTEIQEETSFMDAMPTNKEQINHDE